MDIIGGSESSGKMWIKDHPSLAWCPGDVVEAGMDDDHYLVVDDEGEQFTVQKDDALYVHPSCLSEVDDLLKLGEFHQGALLHNSRLRYKHDKIYTGIGRAILLSVNPFQPLPLYSEEVQEKYYKCGSKGRTNDDGDGKTGLAPHLYSVAHDAYRDLFEGTRNMSIIISGESGSGKTEATKRILEYLAFIQKRQLALGKKGISQSDVSESSLIAESVLRSNPILEAFGNAKTVRNDNSSRFGKFVQVNFSNMGKLKSAHISNYLLEKCRIVGQNEGERNYHIFYQLCAGASDDLRESLGLQSAEDYKYLNGETVVDDVEDGDQFDETLECMYSLGFDATSQRMIFQILAAILHIGNLEFFEDAAKGEGTHVSFKSAAKIAELLGVDPDDLRQVIRFRTLQDPVTKKTINMPNNVDRSTQICHAMVKSVYARLFDWLVKKVNEHMGSGGPKDSSAGGSSRGGASARKKQPENKDRYIGLLDIYGFEVFESNSFEQLCINFANEKLQQQFNHHIFSSEQSMYQQEEIDWKHIEFQDNQHIIDSLDKRPLGVFNVLDSECLMPKATDQTFLNKVLSKSASKTVYKADRFASNQFAVAHYAGEVSYDVDCFLEKNADKMHGDITNLLKKSRQNIICTLFSDPEFTGQGDGDAPPPRTPGRPGRTPSRRGTGGLNGQPSQKQKTVGLAFREQLDKLVEMLSSTYPRYVRCIKPNCNKAPNDFDSIDILRQLRSAGMLESIRIRKAGYPIRLNFRECFMRYRHILPQMMHKTITSDFDYKKHCGELVKLVVDKFKKEGIVAAQQKLPFQVGKGKIFMKDELKVEFERRLVTKLQGYVVVMQKRGRGALQRRKYKQMRWNIVFVQARVRAFIAKLKYRVLLRQTKAATMLQKHLRSYQLRHTFRAQRTATNTIQRHARGWFIRRRIGDIKSARAQEKIRKQQEEQAQKERMEAAERENALLQERLAKDAEERELERERMKEEMTREAEAKRSQESEEVAELKKQLEEERAKMELIRANPHVLENVNDTPTQHIGITHEHATPMAISNEDDEQRQRAKELMEQFQAKQAAQKDDLDKTIAAFQNHEIGGVGFEIPSTQVFVDQSTNDDLRRQIEARDEELEKLRNDYSISRANFAEAELELGAAKAQCEHKDTQLQELAKAIQILQAEVEKPRDRQRADELEEHNRQLRELANDQTAKVDDLSSSLAEARQLNGELMDQMRKVMNSEEQTGGLTTNAAFKLEQERLVQRYEQELKQAKVLLTEAKGKQLQSEERIAALQKENFTNKTCLSNVTAENGMLQKRVDKFEKERKEGSTDSVAAKSIKNVEQLTMRVVDLQNSLNEKDQAFRDSQFQLEKQKAISESLNGLNKLKYEESDLYVPNVSVRDDFTKARLDKNKSQQEAIVSRLEKLINPDPARAGA